MSPIIEIQNISKEFPARRGFRDLRGKGGFTDWIRGHKEEKFAALRDISLSVEAGESLGIIGRNGSGKSTLLSIIAGVTLPTSGLVKVQGRVASLLELGAGFSPVLTGRENIYLNAGLLGMRHAQVDAVYDEIVRFSGIADFIDQPVETYSSGMYVRIGFSVAAFVNPDIFLADEVLAVGDEEFQRKCRRKIGELREQGKTIVFVSHDLGTINTLCERVVLLDNGKMMQRDTAQKTIIYYLRQVGREKGIHTFRDGAEEAIQCDGRITLFHEQEEISASTGFRVHLTSLGQEHSSTDAEWEVSDRNNNGCSATGSMARLPIQLIWELSFESGRLLWRIAMVCERECPVTNIAINFQIPVAYTRWLYGDLTGGFPDIEPTDTNWSVVVAPEAKSTETAVLPEAGSVMPPLMFRLQEGSSRFSLFWANTEYANYSRVLCVQAHFPDHDCVFSAGRHDLVEIEVDPTIPAARIEEHVFSSRTIRSGRVTARFESGCIRLLWDDQEITSYLHVYTSLLIEHLWNDSQSLQWRSITPIPGGIRFVGESRRFPFSQEWEVLEAESGIQLRIWLVTTDALTVQEYHSTVVLPAEYTQWKTDHEQGEFPEYDSEVPNWKHCNQSYAPGRSITSLSGTLPSITMSVDDECPQVRMTAINTSLRESSRVLQALHPSDVGRLQFTAGRHLYFSGTIRITPPKSE
ncbi:MAG: ABC transporter ATP-binding protein [Candidatus Hydrogenedentes bacterium]|nr:ABC transporter ATP-binding protein [Candidatus Hydrogenedentota bacterium]